MYIAHKNRKNKRSQTNKKSSRTSSSSSTTTTTTSLNSHTKRLLTDPKSLFNNNTLSKDELNNYLNNGYTFCSTCGG